MAILAQDNGSEQREKPAPGMVDAVCVFVVDIGNHLIKSSFGDKIQHRVIFCWEVEEKIQHGEYAGKPFMVSQQFTLSLFEKANLAKALESWLSKKISDEQRKTGIDLEKFVGMKCTLNLIESDDGKYINVGAVLPANKNNSLIPVCTKKPDWIQKKIDSQIKIIAKPPTTRQPGEDEPFGDQPQDGSNQLPF